MLIHFYLFGKDGESEQNGWGERAFLSVYLLPRGSTMARARLGSNWEPGIQSRPPRNLKRHQHQVLHWQEKRTRTQIRQVYCQTKSLVLP